MTAKSSQPCGGVDPGDRIQEIEPYRLDRCRTALTCLLVVASGGLLLLAITWRPTIKLRLICRRCELQQADRVLIKDGYGQLFEEKIINEHKDKSGITTPAHFINKKVKYIWDESQQLFSRLSYLDGSTRWSDLCCNTKTGLSHDQSMKRRRLYGENHLHIQKPSVLKLLYEQGVNPFYLMQIYSFVLWFSSGYFEFALATIAVAILSISLTVWEARRQTTALRRHIKSRMSLTILRNSLPLRRDSRDLVPGEVLIMSGHCPFSLDCDVVLLSGTCVVDESALTGESHPLYKLPLSPDEHKLFDLEENKQNIIFSGTKILQIKGTSDVLAVVIRTGFDTQKGELVRSIMFPKPVDFQFYSDFTKYVIFCLVLGVLAALYSAYVWHRNNAPLVTIVLFSLDIMTFVVPVPLPITLTFMYGNAQRRLKRSGIYCLCAKYILLCGNVDVFCFDKTGTLTESELGFAALLPCDPGTGFSDPVTEPTSVDSNDPRVLTLASCHGLSIIDGEPQGDPLDLPLFNAVNWELHEQLPADSADFPDPVTTFVRPRCVVGAGGATAADLDVAVYKQYPFTSASRRAAVLARRRRGPGLDVYIKGAPEAVSALCDPVTVPANFQDALDWYTSQGLRVVGLAWKTLDPRISLENVQELEQEELESGARFLGLVVMQNAIRGSAYQPLDLLHRADITPVMLTGDNLLTAVNVARECGLVERSQTILRVQAEVVPSSVKAAQHLSISYSSPETARSQTFLKSKFRAVHGENYVFAVDGTTFELLRTLDPATLRRVVHRGRVFARMSPQQKVQVVEMLQQLGHQVGMCGDGCNDCGALRTAQAGVSLSPAEPSAAAPFTSRAGTVSSVPSLIREGRAAQVSSFALFKNLLSMGLVIMLMALMLYSHGCEPLSPHFIIEAIVLGTPGPFLLCLVGAHPRLGRRRPPAHLAGPQQVASSLSFVLLQYLTLLVVMHYTVAQPWFEPASSTTTPITDFNTQKHMQPTFEASAMLVSVCFVTIMSWLVFSPGSPFRQPVYTNYSLMVMMLLSLVVCCLVMFYRGAAWSGWLRMMYSPYPEYYLVVATFTIAMGLLSYVWEEFVIQGYPGVKLSNLISKFTSKKPPHEIIEEELRKNKDWPPLKQNEDIQMDEEQTKIDLDPEVQPLTDEVVGEEPTWHARGILKKPSFRDNSWKHHVDTMTSSPEMTSSPPEWTTPSPVLVSSQPAFNTFRVAKTRGEAAAVNRPSIILEETPMIPLSLDPHLDSGDAADALESEA